MRWGTLGGGVRNARVAKWQTDIKYYYYNNNTRVTRLETCAQKKNAFTSRLAFKISQK